VRGRDFTCEGRSNENDEEKFSEPPAKNPQIAQEHAAQVRSAFHFKAGASRPADLWTNSSLRYVWTTRPDSSPAAVKGHIRLIAASIPANHFFCGESPLICNGVSRTCIGLGRTDYERSEPMREGTETDTHWKPLFDEGACADGQGGITSKEF
jgi:hypothetical protein